MADEIRTINLYRDGDGNVSAELEETFTITQGELKYLTDVAVEDAVAVVMTVNDALRAELKNQADENEVLLALLDKQIDRTRDAHAAQFDGVASSFLMCFYAEVEGLTMEEYGILLPGARDQFVAAALSMLEGVNEYLRRQGLE